MRRSSAAVLAIGIGVALVAAGSAGSARTASTPTQGGTLKILGQSDIFNLDTTSGYYTVDNILERSLTRQLVSYPTAPSFLAQIQLKPDIATAVPTKANGGLSGDGKTVTATGITTVFTNLEGFPEDWKTNVPAFIKFVREHQRPSFLEYGEYPHVSADEIKKALKLKAAFSNMLDQMQ